MAKLSSATTALSPPKNKAAQKKHPIQTKKEKTTKTHYGVEVPELKAKSELFLAAISTFAGEDTFYESGQERIDRVVNLVHKVTASDPDWMRRFIVWLRGPEANIRTLPLIMATEYVAAGGPKGRQVIADVCQRADEPAEILAYWMQQYYGWDTQTYPLPSPKVPQALRKGLADAVCRLYTEYSVMKYDGNARGVGMYDVLNIVHPKPTNYPSDWTESRIEKQKAIFQYIMDHGGRHKEDPKVDKLPTLKANLKLRVMTPEKFREKSLDTEILSKAGVTWEQLGGLLGGPFDAKAWEAIIPTMGYMALLRNLRNFEGAGISKTYQKVVIDRLTNPEEVARSRQLPFRFLSAYKHMNSTTYLNAISEAGTLACANIPEFDGGTLVLIDKSGSMDSALSSQSSVSLWEVGALFGVAMALKNPNSRTVIFGDKGKEITLPKGSDLMTGMRLFQGNQGVGHGTNIWGTIADFWREEERVVIFTDVQSYGRPIVKVPLTYYFDIGGYGKAAPDIKSPGVYHFGGFSDATFKMMAALEHGNTWPF